MKVSFILVEPAVPENVGAAARAMKTMGFADMRLVNPCDHLSEPARWLAHASNDILENALVFPDFEEAVKDLDFIIGTSAKQRGVKEDYYSTRDLVKIIQTKGKSVKHLGIVFGREDSGLRNEELRRCDMVSTVPLQTTYPSLNLAQAIMLYAYELSQIHQSAEIEEKPEVNENGFRALKDKSSKLLLELDFKEESAIYPRILERLNLLGESDIHLLHSICNKYFEKMSKT
ncbi:tRNA/rRNA methyltransferase [Mangrovibacterium diazotrophicum]|uniref:tRNA (cytidine/uridine-2'-O-)-methyltransferase TrmJ n=1 Tax=Mangrovibacterium diazotrophicum TaxID=1261403 RepID=A0A419VZ88_9BACT|nr:tRNA/rRNA methyltransferase [Mangrovibacterium diazotrophicum]RKD88380.1 tRNA/rRNA methyltransferase [Mangrovibacterium diazotrophicum]